MRRADSVGVRDRRAGDGQGGCGRRQRTCCRLARDGVRRGPRCESCGRGSSQIETNESGQVYLLCVWHLRSVNTHCIAFSGEILDFLSFSDHLLVIFGQVSLKKKKNFFFLISL